jgi:outer membrane protein assembly factor BamB
MVIGYRVETTKDNSELAKLLDNLRFVCTDANGFSEGRYKYYKEKLLSQYSLENKLEDEIKPEEETIFKESLIGSTSIGPMDSAWPMKCLDNRHTSQSPYSTADTTSLEKWRFKTDNWVEGGPALDSDGTIYFGCFDRYLYALYPDGVEKWKYKLDGWIWSTPAIDADGIVYIGCAFGLYTQYLYAINSNGTLKWKFSGVNKITSSPAVSEDGIIYFGDWNGFINALNPNGTAKWRYRTGDWITSDPAIGDDGTIYIGSMDDYFYALYPNGTLKWRFLIGDRIYGSPSIADDGTIYIGSSWNGYLYALYPNGTLKWKYAGAGTPNNPSIGNDGTIYAGYLYNFVALNPNGTLKWGFDIGNNRFIGSSAPAISADGTIYFGVHLGTPGYSEGGEIIAVNPDGTERWRKKIAKDWVESSPCIAEDGTVYIGSSYDASKGYLHAFGPVESNEPPEAPTISGTTNGKAGWEYPYTFVAHDPDNNPIQLFVDWDDGDSGWVDWFASDEEEKIRHTWTTQGDYTIKAKVKDVFDEESDWATFEVKIERKSREVQQMLFYRLIEQFPILQKILCYIL